jgi:predicted Rossmann-fold nucleotide-binding protein
MSSKLYTSADLLRGYVEKEPDSYVRTWDFEQFRHFIAEGGPTPKMEADTLRQAQHDARMSYALGRYLDQVRTVGNETPKLVGIMGGHGVRRTDDAFKLIANIARRLTRERFQIVTGGGPGAMEAGHFGAYFANSSDPAFADALEVLATQPTLPDLSKILTPAGEIDPTRTADIHAAHKWLTAALSARDKADDAPGVSLAVPTWLYGSEPTTPFATAYAKYYQNSIREETLVTEGQTGILFAQGGGGTLREIFQAVEHNYYAPNAAGFTPMIFVDPDQYWQRDATFDAQGNVVEAGIKVDEMLQKVFKRAIKPAERAACAAKVCFTTDIDQILRVLRGHAPVAQANLRQMLGGVAANLLSPRWAH